MYLLLAGAIGLVSGCRTLNEAQLQQVEDAAFFVSPGGNDVWSGTLPEPNPDGSDGPLATLAAARDVVRDARKGQWRGRAVTVLMRGGVYELESPVRFGPRDSGDQDKPVTYSAYPGERPVVSGGIRVRGWHAVGDGTWAAALPEGVAFPNGFRSLYVNGERRPMARTPNTGEYFRIAASAPLLVDPETGQEVNSEKFAFRFREGDLRAWPRIEEINAVVLRNWESAILPIRSIDEANSSVVFAGPMKWELRRNLRYYVEGFREALDAPGEWWFDRQENMLFYRPKPGEKMERLSVVVPRLTELLVLAGDPVVGQPLEHVTFDGIAFRHTDYAVPPTGHSDWQAAVTIPAAIQADGAHHVTFRRCDVRNIGQYGIWFRRGCRGNRIEQCEVADLGAGGVRIGAQATSKEEQEQSGGNTVHNCFIHDVGSVFYGAIPIWIGQSSDNVVSHNEVCDANYTGISVGWSWGFRPTTCHRNTIEYNHLHHLGRGVLYDMAAIYTLGISTGTVIRGNRIHHIWGWEEGYGAGGIYPDEGSTGLLIEDNLVYCTQNGGLTVHYGRENVARNNIFALGQRAQIHLGRKDKESSQTLENNIIYYTQGELFRRMSTLTSARNLYWHAGGDDPEFPEGKTLAEWQAEGHDQHSVVADPGFINPETHDFRLRPDSPALALGFKPFDASKAGLVGDVAWVRRPLAIDRGATVMPPRKDPPPVMINDGFEETPLGAEPLFGTVHGQTAGASIRVSDETAASGRRCLKFIDVAGLKNIWNPHIYLHPRLRKGVLHGSFDLKLEAGAVFTTEWRTDASPFVGGPRVQAMAGGMLTINGEDVVEADVGKWIHVDLVCDVRSKEGKTCHATVRVEGQPTRTLEVAVNDRFKGMDWIVFVSDANENSVFYLDNVVLELEKPK